MSQFAGTVGQFGNMAAGGSTLGWVIAKTAPTGIHEER
jgi:hypothetical protein